jgi:hypothetical protein
MGKRTPHDERKARKEANKHDLWPTPYKPILPLLPHLEPGTRFIEPCAGDGRLIGYLQEHGHVCEGAWDIEPQDECIRQLDARYLVTGVDRHKLKIITNPPWTRALLHPLIVHFAGQHDTWLLFDADWAHTQQANPYLRFCEKVVSVGRVRWLEGQESDRGNDPKDNCAWYLFTAAPGRGPVFYGRQDQ